MEVSYVISYYKNFDIDYNFIIMFNNFILINYWDKKFFGVFAALLFLFTIALKLLNLSSKRQKQC